MLSRTRFYFQAGPPERPAEALKFARYKLPSENLPIGLPGGQGPDMGKTKVNCLGLPWPFFIYFPFLGSMLLNIGNFEDHPHLSSQSLPILQQKTKSSCQQKKYIADPKVFTEEAPFMDLFHNSPMLRRRLKYSELKKTCFLI